MLPLLSSVIKVIWSTIFVIVFLMGGLLSLSGCKGSYKCLSIVPVVLSIVCNPSPAVPIQKLPRLSSKIARTLLSIRLCSLFAICIYLVNLPVFLSNLLRPPSLGFAKSNGLPVPTHSVPCLSWYKANITSQLSDDGSLGIFL